MYVFILLSSEGYGMNNKNLQLAEDIKKRLLSNKEIEMCIRGQATGSISIFVRKFKCQKINYLAVELDSRTFNSDNDDWDGIELPSNVYKRFCMLLADMISDIQSDIEYGHLNCSWEFVNDKGSGEWEEHTKVLFTKEHHFQVS